MVNVIWQNRADTGRVAEIDGKFYPYHWSLSRAQVSWSKWFSQHSEDGIKYVSYAYSTLQQAKRAYWNSCRIRLYGGE